MGRLFSEKTVMLLEKKNMLFGNINIESRGWEISRSKNMVGQDYDRTGCCDVLFVIFKRPAAVARAESAEWCRSSRAYAENNY